MRQTGETENCSQLIVLTYFPVEEKLH